MLKDKKGWVEFLEIAENLWRRIMHEALNKAITLTDSAEKLLQNAGNEAISAGLYMYAIEEYGKFLFLKQLTPSSGKVTMKYKNGFRKHSVKFRIALKQLPNECITLRQGLFDPEIFDPAIFDTEDEVIKSCETREAVFYSDFTKTAGDIEDVPYVDRECLKNAINQFKMILSGTTIS